MQEYEKLIKTVPLFKDIDWDDFRLMLNCLKAETKLIPKNDIVILTGEKPIHTGVVLAGKLHIVEESYNGNRTLIAEVSPGEIFAETMCCADVDESPVTVFAAEDTTALMFNFYCVLHPCPNLCQFHQKLIENMLIIVANKNLFLQSRMMLVSIKSIREKVLRYLEALAIKQGPNIVIPFNQTKLAEYLCVERSALAHELARMKKDGLIDYKKNTFVLY